MSPLTRSIILAGLCFGAIRLVLGDGWDLGKQNWTAQPSPTNETQPALHSRQVESKPPPTDKPLALPQAPTNQEEDDSAGSDSNERPAAGTEGLPRSLADRSVELWNDTYSRITDLLNSPTARTQADRTQATIGRAWDACREHVTRILALHDEKRDLPENALLRRDRGDVDKRIKRLLDGVVDALEISGLSACREEYMGLDAQIRKATRRIIACEEKKISAPEESSRFNPFSVSRKRYEKMIAGLRTRIQEHRKQQHALVSEMHKEYKRIGIDITREHVEFYLASVSGKDIVGLSAVFHNVKELNRKLEELMQRKDSEAAAYRRYYGVHVVLVHALVHAHDVMIERIDEKYLPRLATIAEENREVGERTKKLMDQGNTHSAVLQANLRAQRYTTEAIAAYEQHLDGLKNRVGESRSGVRKRYLVAKNTYDTILVASALVEEMEACVRDLMALRDMHLPNLVPLDDRAVQEKFVEISALLSDE